MALIQRAHAPQVPFATSPEAPLRRCTFRRVTAVPRGRSLPVYDVACMYPKRESPVPLGDLETSRAICDACTARGIFRPDEV